MSVFERPKGSGNWYLSVTVNGKRVRKAIKEARTLRQAQRAERILRDEIYENRFGAGGQRLFADFVEKSYKPHAKEHKKSYSVELSISKVLIERFGKQKLFEITTESVEQFKRDLASEETSTGKTRAKATVNRTLAVLSAVFSLAKSFGEVKENPINSVKFYDNLPSRERILSIDEEIALFEFIRADATLSRQVEILLYTGMRRGELFKLEWRDIDLIEGYIAIRKEITKTNTARDVPMLPNVQEIFETLRGEAGDAAGTTKIFIGISSQANQLSNKFKSACSHLGIENLTVHSLRHTFSTRADESGVGAFAQKALLGHSKLSMTDKYTHLSKETLKASLGSMEHYKNRTKDTKPETENENNVERPNLLPFKKK